MEATHVPVDTPLGPEEAAKSKALTKAAGQLQKVTLNTVESGVGPISGSRVYADDRLKHSGGDPETAIKRIIRESVIAAGTTGFATGIGGFVAMPITLPANITGNLIINARMVGAIAHLRGFELNDPHTQAMLMLTVAGSSAQSVSSAFGIKIGQQLANQALKKIPMTVIQQINNKAGFYLVAKYGTQRSMVTLAKGVPGIGGLVGGGVDATLTRGIGSVAKKVFPQPSTRLERQLGCSIETPRSLSQSQIRRARAMAIPSISRCAWPADMQGF